MNNNAYMNQVMDFMQTKHPDVVLSSVFFIAKRNMQMQEKMMDKITAMCKMDTSMSKIFMTEFTNMLDHGQYDCCKKGKRVIGKAMEMSDDDQSDCCKKGKMIMGKTGEMSEADKLICCTKALKKSTAKAE